MAKQIINIGRTANDKSGDPLRTAFTKVNENFTELYSAIGADIQIPVQTGNEGKYLTTNGTTLSWNTINTSANTGNTGFITDTIYNINGIFIENADLTHGATAAVSIPENGETVTPLSLQNNYGPVSIITGLSPSILKTWTFSTDGSLSLPSGGTISDTVTSTIGTIYTFISDVNSQTPDIISSGYIDLNPLGDALNVLEGWIITFNDSEQRTITSKVLTESLQRLGWMGDYTSTNVWPITIQSPDYSPNGPTKLVLSPNSETTWEFNVNGKLTLPAGGDIVDSTGTSVLGSITIDGGDSSTTF